MKLPTSPTLSLVALTGISLVTPALAIVTIDYVSVGHAGNAADTTVMNDSTTGYGAVAYAYQIGK